MQVADLNALAELGKVYQDSLALSAQLRNLSSFRLQQDKVLGRGSLAVVQEGERRACGCAGQGVGLSRISMQIWGAGSNSWTLCVGGVGSQHIKCAGYQRSMRSTSRHQLDHLQLIAQHSECVTPWQVAVMVPAATLQPKYDICSRNCKHQCICCVPNMLRVWLVLLCLHRGICWRQCGSQVAAHWQCVCRGQQEGGLLGAVPAPPQHCEQLPYSHMLRPTFLVGRCDVQIVRCTLLGTLARIAFVHGLCAISTATVDAPPLTCCS